MPPYEEKEIFSGEDLAKLLSKKMPSCKIILLTMYTELLKIKTIIRSIQPNGLIIKNDLTFDELLSVSNYEEGSLFFSGFANVINAMRKCPKLIIGRIHGKAVGGGVGLAAACDYSFATSKSDVKLSEIIQRKVRRKMWNLVYRFHIFCT